MSVAPSYTYKEICSGCGKFLGLHRGAAYGAGQKDRIFCFHCGVFTVPGTGGKSGQCLENTIHGDRIVVGAETDEAIHGINKVIQLIRKGLK